MGTRHTVPAAFFAFFAALLMSGCGQDPTVIAEIFVQDSSGNPVDGAYVTAYSDYSLGSLDGKWTQLNGTITATGTTRDGRLTMQIIPGNYAFKASIEGQSGGAEKLIIAGTNTISITLTRTSLSPQDAGNVQIGKAAQRPEALPCAGICITASSCQGYDPSVGKCPEAWQVCCAPRMLTNSGTGGAAADSATGRRNLPNEPAGELALPHDAYALFEFEGGFGDSKGKLTAKPAGDARISADTQTGTGVAVLEQKRAADYISINAPETLRDTDYAIIILARPDSAANQSIFSKTNESQSAVPSPGPGTLGALVYQLRINNGVFEHYSYDLGKTVTGTTKIAPGEWYQVAITAKSSGQMRLFVNGIEDGTPQSAAKPAAAWQGGTRYEVATPGQNTAGFKGQIDSLAIYRSGLEPGEIFEWHYEAVLAPKIEAMLAKNPPQENAGAPQNPVCGDGTCQLGEESCTQDCRFPGATQFTEVPPGPAPDEPYVAVILQALPDPLRPEADQEFFVSGKVTCEGGCKGKKATVATDPGYKPAYIGLNLSPAENAKTEAQVDLSAGTAQFMLGPYKSGGPNFLCGNVVVTQDSGGTYNIPVEVGVKATQQYCNTYGGTMPGGCDNYEAELEGGCFIDYLAEREVQAGHTYYQLRNDIAAQMTLIEDEPAITANAGAPNAETQGTIASFAAGEVIPAEVQKIEAILDNSLRRLEVMERHITELDRYVREYRVSLNLSDVDIYRIEYGARYDRYRAEKRTVGLVVHEKFEDVRDLVSRESTGTNWRYSHTKESLKAGLATAESAIEELKGDLAHNQRLLAQVNLEIEHARKISATLKPGTIDKITANRDRGLKLTQDVEDKIVAFRTAQNVLARGLDRIDNSAERNAKKALLERLYTQERPRLLAEMEKIATQSLQKYPKYGARLAKLVGPTLKWGTRAVAVAAIARFFTTDAKAIAMDLKDGKILSASDKIADYLIVYAAAKGIALTAQDIDSFMKTSSENWADRGGVVTDLESGYGQTFYTTFGGKKIYYEGKAPESKSAKEIQDRLNALAAKIAEWKKSQKP